MKGSDWEWNIYVDATLILCCEKDNLWFCVLYLHNWKHDEMFKKSALLMICCDISTKSLENVHLTCENSTKANKKNCS